MSASLDPVAVPASPPTGAPPVVLTADFSDPASAAAAPGTPGRLDGGRLVLESDGAGVISTGLICERPLRDGILDANISLVAGDEVDMVGLYLRQSKPDRYLACGFGVLGSVGVVAVDGEARQPIIQGIIAPDMPFNGGLGASNRITVIASGPCITFLLNGAVVAGITVDPRYQEGYAGVLMSQGGAGPARRAEVAWVQVRALLPEVTG